MLVEADDDGRLVADPAQLRALIFAYHPKVAVSHVVDGIETMAAVGLIKLYTAGETRYVQFPSWRDHQRIHRDHYTPSKLPPPLDCGTGTAQVPQEGGTSTVPVQDTGGTGTAGSDRIGEDRKGSDRRGKEGSVRGGKPRHGQKLTMSEPSNGHSGAFADTLAAIKLRHPELNDPDAEAKALSEIEADARGRTR